MSSARELCWTYVSWCPQSQKVVFNIKNCSRNFSMVDPVSQIYFSGLCGCYSYRNDGRLILAAGKLEVMSVENTERCLPPTAPVPRIQEEKRLESINAVGFLSALGYSISRLRSHVGWNVLCECGPGADWLTVFVSDITVIYSLPRGQEEMAVVLFFLIALSVCILNVQGWRLKSLGFPSLLRQNIHTVSQLSVT